MPGLCPGRRRRAAGRKKNRKGAGNKKRDRRDSIDPPDWNRRSNYFADGGIHLAVSEQGDNAMMIGFTGVAMDHFVQRG